MLWHMATRSGSPERHVRLFKNGRNQAVRIPREFELASDSAIMRKEGERLVLGANTGEISTGIVGHAKAT